MRPNTEGITPVGLENTDGVQINPATEEKQDDIVVALGGATPVTTIGADTATVVTAGTPVQLANHTCKWVIITNPSNNDIYLGGSSVDAQIGTEMGLLLPPKNATEKIFISNTNLLYVDATGNGTRITYLYGN